MKNLTGVLIAGVILLLLVSFAYVKTEEPVHIHVKRVERSMVGTGSNVHGKYLVFTNNEVFENTDSFLFMKFNSSDLQNQLEPGKDYTVLVAGWRIPLFSTYRNIIKIKNEP